MPDHHELAIYSGFMRLLSLFWFFVWRMVAWMIFCGVVLGVLIAILIEILGHAEGGTGEVVGALGRGALAGGFIGMPPGVLGGIGLAVLTVAFRRLPERTGSYRMIAVATCAGVVLVPAGLLALLANDYEGVGTMMFAPTYFEIFGIPLIVSAPFAALGAQKVAKTYSHRADTGS
jgi:hypothetical protein